jgi:hypothetical protein
VADRARTWRLAAWAGAGVFVGVMTVALLVNVVARTPRGHEWVLQQTLDALAPDINGTLVVERAAGNLFEGAWLYGLSLSDEAGDPFIEADSAWVDYGLRTLLSPNIVLHELILYQPRISVRRLPDDPLWNYEHIFRDPDPDPAPPEVERATFVTLARMVGGTVVVEQPWEPDPRLSEAARARELEEALADDSRILVREVPGGHLWTWNFTDVHAQLSEIRFAPGSERGSRIHVDSLRARAQIFREPAEVLELRGAIALIPGRVEIDLPAVRLPASDLGIRGAIHYPEDEDEPRYDLVFHGRDVAFADLQWLYPLFPDDAAGTLDLRLETRPEGTLFLARDARIRAPGTRIEGSFGIIVGDTIRFTEVDVEADPVSVPVVEGMLPEGLPVRGLRLGGVEIRGSG